MECHQKARLATTRYTVCRYLSCWAGLCWAGLCCGIDVGNAVAVSPVDYASDPAAVRLTAPMNVVFQGQSIGQALQSVGQASGSNLWVQRDLDTSVVLEAVRMGSTTGDTLDGLVERLDAQWIAVRGVVLIGRANWLDRNLEAIHRCCDGDGPSAEPVVSVKWPRLATPSEVWRLIDGAAGLGVTELRLAEISEPPQTDDVLPHDLWDAGALSGVPRRLAKALIRGQFDENSLAESRADVNESWEHEYRAKWSRREVRSALSGTGGQAQSLDGGRAWRIRGPAGAHRRMRQAAWERLRRSRSAKQENAPEGVYDLKLVNESIDKFLRSAAATAGLTYRVEPSAEPSVQTLVSFEVKGMTLVELSHQVAAKAGLTVRWTATELVVEKSTP